MDPAENVSHKAASAHAVDKGMHTHMHGLHTRLCIQNHGRLQQIPKLRNTCSRS